MKKVREIIGLALLLQEISDFHVFIDHSGHVKCVTIRVIKKNGEDKDFHFREQFYYSHLYNEEDFMKIKEFLTFHIAELTAV